MEKPMKFSLFLGCTTPARARNYELSTRKVAEAFDIELVDCQDYVCCGFPMKAVNSRACLLMAARNLAAGEQQGLEICTVCSACTSVLTEVNEELKHDEALRAEVNGKLSQLDPPWQVEGKARVRHFARILLEDVGVEKIKEKVTKDLSALKIAPHYGCHYMKPSAVYERFDDPEHPQTLDTIVEATGAQPIAYEDKTQCCGGAVLAVDQDVSFTITRRKLEHVKEAGADAIVLVCPFCSVMYDDNQRTIATAAETKFDLPVLYLPQLIGLAMGLEPKELGLNMNRVKPKELLSKVA